MPRDQLSKCVEIINNLPYEKTRFPCCSHYCFDKLTKGECSASNCKYLHQRITGSDKYACPPAFGIDDSFKQTCNKILSELGELVEERRCLILDGRSGSTAKALKRDRGLILSPNVDPGVVKAVAKHCQSVECTASSAIIVASQQKVKFGMIYLDYMWPLDYFERGLQSLPDEKVVREQQRKLMIRDIKAGKLPALDGFHDVARLCGLEPTGGSAILSDKNTILAVTIVRPFSEQQEERLEMVLSKGGDHLSRYVYRLGHYTEDNRKVRTVFYLLSGCVTPSSWNKFQHFALMEPRIIVAKGAKKKHSSDFEQREQSTASKSESVTQRDDFLKQLLANEFVEEETALIDAFYEKLRSTGGSGRLNIVVADPKVDRAKADLLPKCVGVVYWIRHRCEQHFKLEKDPGDNYIMSVTAVTGMARKSERDIFFEQLPSGGYIGEETTLIDAFYQKLYSIGGNGRLNIVVADPKVDRAKADLLPKCVGVANWIRRRCEKHFKIEDDPAAKDNSIVSIKADTVEDVTSEKDAFFEQLPSDRLTRQEKVLVNALYEKLARVGGKGRLNTVVADPRVKCAKKNLLPQSIGIARWLTHRVQKHFLVEADPWTVDNQIVRVLGTARDEHIAKRRKTY